MTTTARFVLQGDDRTHAATRSAMQNFRSLERSIGSSMRSMSSTFSSTRSMLAGLGVIAGARMFTNFMSDAIKTSNLLGDQRAAIDAAASSWNLLGKEIKQAAAEKAAALSPYSRAVADEIRRSFFPESFGKTAEQMRAELEDLKSLVLPAQINERDNVDFLERFFGMDEAEWARRIDVTIGRINELKAAITRFETVAVTKPVNFGIRWNTLSEGNLNMQLAAFGHTKSAMRKPNIALESLTGDGLQEFAVHAREMSVSNLMRAMPKFDPAAIAASFKPIVDESKRTAELIGDSFRDSFGDWMMGAETDFRSLLKRMAIDMAVSGIFNQLGGLFGGSSSGIGKFFGSFFGGGRADGGPVSAGRAYVVGERGPELFLPGRSGTIAANGAGGGVTINYNVDARGATMELAKALPGILSKHGEQIKSEILYRQRRGQWG